MKDGENYARLIRDGFCIFESVLEEEEIERLRELTDRAINAQGETHFHAHRSQGSLIDVRAEFSMVDLIAGGNALKALASLGFGEPKWASGYIISKPPHSPPLYWHQDWWGWDDPDSYGEVPHQVFLMYYLVDTNRENGCLRVIPGSHCKRHALHGQTLVHDDEAILQAADLNNRAFQPVPDEIDVLVRAGDLIIGDSRLFHAAHANTTGDRRTVITLWYYPCFDSLSEPLRAAMLKKWTDHERTYPWPEEVTKRIDFLVPRYEGNAAPLAANRSPGPALL